MDKKLAVESLGRVLADTYILQLKTQSVHWHVVGSSFFAVHTLTELQYTELFTAVDEIAERIRALGADAPGSMAEFLKISRLKEGIGGSSDAEMVGELARVNRQMAELMRSEIDVMDDIDDYGSEDLLIRRLQVHEKSAWMLESLLVQLGAPAALLAPAPIKAEKKVKKEKKEKPVKLEPLVAVKKSEPVVESDSGSRRRLFGVKADG
jgi:starvation-inducible DNA-binding protein